MEANVVPLRGDTRASTLIGDIERACDGPSPRFVGRLLSTLQHHAADDRLRHMGRQLALDIGRRQHVLYVDPQLRFSIVVLIWRPKQASTVHAHRSWRAFTVLDGWLREDLFEPQADLQYADSFASSPILPGGTQFRLPVDSTIHRLSNVGTVTAVSLHVRGMGGQQVEHHAAPLEFADT